MPSKEKVNTGDKVTPRRQPAKPAPPELVPLEHGRVPDPVVVQKARSAPHLLSARNVLQFQRTVGNRVMGRILRSVQRQQAPQDELEEENNTGLPDHLKAGVENLSGMSIDDVRVHYNSSKPAELQALAYTQGTDIHVGPGQEGSLAHEAWHVVQQKQGRVQATTHSMSLPVNDDLTLEKEADTLGEQAARQTFNAPDLLERNELRRRNGQLGQAVCQRYSEINWEQKKLTGGKKFRSQSTDPSFVKDKLKHKFHEEDLSKPPLLVSDDLTMAVMEKKGREAKEFFATEDVKKTSNKKLKAVGSGVRLETTESNALSINKKSTLNRIGPVLAKQEKDQETGKYIKLWSYVCRNVANYIMGTLNIGAKREDIIFNEGTKPSRQEIEVDDFTSPQVEKIVKERTGKDLTSDDEKRGINKYARPDVGEGWATFTTKAKGELKSTLKGKWGHHHAAVVARSKDRKDWITMENYNREPDAKDPARKKISKESPELFKLLELSENDFNKLSKDPQKGKEFVKNWNKAQRLLATLQWSGSDDWCRLWFFRMYGSKKDQTFHERQKSSGEFEDPITFRIGRPKSEVKEHKKKDLAKHRTGFSQEKPETSSFSESSICSVM